MKTKSTKSISFNDLILREARKLARDKLETHLASRDLPLPRDSALEIHIDQLLATNPAILAEAEARVLARQDAYSDGLRAIGIEPTVIQPVEIEL